MRANALITQYIVAAGPVSRILSAGLTLRDGHSSGPRITARLKRPTRRFDAPSQHVFAAEASNFLPIWSCSVWGLPCPRHYCRGGALLPHLFTLTPLTRRYLFCGTLRPSGLNLASRTLSGTLLCGVRTFLPRRPEARKRPSGPAAYISIIRCSLLESSASVRIVVECKRFCSTRDPG